MRTTLMREHLLKCATILSVAWLALLIPASVDLTGIHAAKAFAGDAEAGKKLAPEK